MRLLLALLLFVPAQGAPQVVVFEGADRTNSKLGDVLSGTLRSYTLANFSIRPMEQPKGGPPPDTDAAVKAAKALGATFAVTSEVQKVTIADDKKSTRATVRVCVIEVATGKMVMDELSDGKVARDDPKAAVRAAAFRKVSHMFDAFGARTKAASRPRPAVAKEKRPIVAVLEFVDKTGEADDPRGAIAGDAVWDALAASEQVQLVDPARLPDEPVGDAASAAKLGTKVKAAFAVFGAVTKWEKGGMNNTATIEVRVVKVDTGEIVASLESQGESVPWNAIQAAITAKTDALVDAVVAPACTACKKAAKTPDLCAKCGGCKTCCKCR